MNVTSLPAAGPDLQRWCEIFAVGQSADSGSRADPRALALRPPRDAFGVYDNGRLVGAASVRPDGDEYAFARIYVPAEERRHGAGRALYEAVADWARTHGHGSVKATVVTDGPGEAFATALGATVLLRLVTVERRLDASAPPVAEPAELEMIRWSDRCPQELLADYARLRQAVGDAPGAHHQIDAAVRDADWVRTWERQRTESGSELWVAAAVHNGQMVGFTEVEVPSIGDASQHDTAVLPEWRGRGVATWLKADMIERLRRRRPVVGRLTSTISEDNSAMLAVSRRLGFTDAWRRQLVAIAVTPAG